MDTKRSPQKGARDYEEAPLRQTRWEWCKRAAPHKNKGTTTMEGEPAAVGSGGAGVYRSEAEQLRQVLPLIGVDRDGV